MDMAIRGPDAAYDKPPEENTGGRPKNFKFKKRPAAVTTEEKKAAEAPPPVSASDKARGHAPAKKKLSKTKMNLDFGKPGIGKSGSAYGKRAYNYATGTSPDPLSPH
jgi:hypothetical protein